VAASALIELHLAALGAVIILNSWHRIHERTSVEEHRELHMQTQRADVKIARADHRDVVVDAQMLGMQHRGCGIEIDLDSAPQQHLLNPLGSSLWASDRGQQPIVLVMWTSLSASASWNRSARNGSVTALREALYQWLRRSLGAWVGRTFVASQAAPWWHEHWC
jgi:hypothetical protein